MKIGIIVERLNQPLTGIGNVVYHLVKELSKYYNHELFLINYKKLEDSPTNHILIKNPFEKISKTYLWYPYAFLKLKRKYKGLDVIHNPSQVPTIFNSKDQRYVVTVYDLTPFITPKEHTTIRVSIYRTFFPRTLKTADMIIVDSYSTKNDIVRYFKIPEEKLRVIHLGVDEDYKPLPEDNVEKIKQKYNLNYPFILYVGTLEPRKNIPTLIKAFYKLKKSGLPHKLVITGKKGWKYKDIFELIDKLELQKDVVFTGYVPKEDLPALYNAADLFIYPSLYEGFGLPPLEAMACGTPVITSNTSSLPEVVGNAGIMVDPYDVDGLAKVMYEVLTNEGLREELRKKGLERAKLFSWKKTAEETLKVYEEVYNRR